jgi:hypothetical protein
MYLCGIWEIVSGLGNAKGAERRWRNVLNKDTIAAYSFFLFIEAVRELELSYVYTARVVRIFFWLLWIYIVVLELDLLHKHNFLASNSILYLSEHESKDL